MFKRLPKYLKANLDIIKQLGKFRYDMLNTLPKISESVKCVKKRIHEGIINTSSPNLFLRN